MRLIISIDTKTNYSVKNLGKKGLLLFSPHSFFTLIKKLSLREGEKAFRKGSVFFLSQSEKIEHHHHHH